ncbi:MAG: sulfotransferase [Balneolaceae bacterium]|nr:sulfotransferase [Balneolaceae bacterium]
MDKIFVVGCPRSGTTLLQSLLASHSEIVSFPETHLFSKTISINSVARFFTVYRNTHFTKVKNIVDDLGGEATHDWLNYPVFNTHTWVNLLLNNLDRVGEANSTDGERYLLEKTPRHLHFVDLIQAVDPSIKVIHIIRRGEDVVASMVEATSDNPDEWKGSRSVEKSIFWWNRSIRHSKKYIGATNNLHIRYENLVTDTEAVLRYLCQKLGLSFENQMVAQHHETAKDMISKGEHWKAKNTSSGITFSDKFNNFPQEVQKVIKNELTDFNYSAIDIDRLN